MLPWRPEGVPHPGDTCRVRIVYSVSTLSPGGYVCGCQPTKPDIQSACVSAPMWSYVSCIWYALNKVGT